MHSTVVRDDVLFLQMPLQSFYLKSLHYPVDSPTSLKNFLDAYMYVLLHIGLNHPNNSINMSKIAPSLAHSFHPPCPLCLPLLIFLSVS